MASIRCGNCFGTHESVQAVKACYASQSNRVASAPVAQKSAAVTEGFYKHDDQVFKVQKAVHGSGRLYAKVLAIETTDDEFIARFEYAPGAYRSLSADDKLTHEQAAEFGKLYGICCICGRTLTNEESIADGIGPVCAGKQGW